MNKKYKIHIVLLMLLFVSLNGLAQDKVFLRDSKVIACKIIAISEKTITYKDTAINAVMTTLPKKDVLLTEYQTGEIYMFSNEDQTLKVEKSNATLKVENEVIETREQRKERKMKEWKEQEALLSNNILGFYIPELILGRFTVSYERLLANKSIGIKIPFSLTYNSFRALSSISSLNSSSTNTTSSSSSTTSSNSNNTNEQPVRGVGFIIGIDVNYYHDIKPSLKYYFGPRLRYGTDMMLGGIEGLTFQLQNGIFKSSGKRFTSTLGVGFGFFKLSERYANTGSYDVKQVYPWASFTWRLGFRL
jgi:hypothetical protein